MTTVSWFSDPDRVLDELRGERGERTQPPQIPGYDELSELSRGGQGIVFAGTQRSTRRRVAVKVLLEGVYASQTDRRRFEREIELVASLRHPHIVRVYDSGTTPDGRLYSVMEFIEGEPLDQWSAECPGAPGRSAESKDDPASDFAIRNPKSEIRNTLALFADVADAVHYAHQRGVMHRDLKPSNILIDGEGRPHILDFGLAKNAALVSSAVARTVSRTGYFMGSLPWASPEQVRGLAAEIDLRSDVYALGVMLYQSLTGRFPYDVTGSIRDVMERILHRDPAPPRTESPHLDDELSTIVLKSLTKEADRRYQTAGDLARDLRHYLAGEPIEAKRDSTWYVLKKTARRYRAAAIAAGVMVLLVLGFAVTVTVLYRGAQAAREAEAAARRAAENGEQKAKQVQEFLQSILASVDPYWAQGRDVGVLRELLDEAARRVGALAEIPPEVEAAIRTTLGQTYQGLGLWDDAKPHLQAALELNGRTLGDHHPETFASRVNWTSWLVDHPGTEGTEAFLTESLEAARRVLGPESGAALGLSVNYASWLHAQGRLAEAEALLRPALDALRRIAGRQDDETVKAMNILAVLLQDMGRWEEAEAQVREVVEIRRRNRGPEHPDTLIALNNLAGIMDAAGRDVEAETMQRQILALELKVLGERHPHTLVVMNNLGSLLQQLGRLAEAEELHRRALRLRQEVLGADSESAFYSLNNLTRVVQDGGRWTEAAPMMRRVVAQAERLFGPEHPHTLTARNTLAANLEMLGHKEEAEILKRSTLAIQQRTLGPGHPSTLITLNSLAVLYRDTGRTDEAEWAYRELLDLAVANLPPAHWYLYVFQSGLGRTLTLSQRFQEAERELLESAAGLEATVGEEYPMTRRAEGFLFELYTAWGKTDRAMNYEPECVEEDPAKGASSR